MSNKKLCFQTRLSKGRFYICGLLIAGVYSKVSSLSILQPQLLLEQTNGWPFRPTEENSVTL